MKIIISFILTAFSICTVHGQIKYKIEIINDSIGYYESLFINSTIQNTTEKEVILTINGTSIIRPFLEYRKLGTKEWMLIKGSQYLSKRKCPEIVILDMPSSHFILPKEVIFPAKHKDILKNTVYELSEEGTKVKDFIFKDRPGKYEIRLQNCLLGKGDSCLTSSIDTLFVYDYSKQENQAIAWLEKHSLRRFLYEPLLNKDSIFCDKSILPTFLPKVEEFYQLFPHSRFAAWAKYYHAYWLLYQFSEYPFSEVDKATYQKARSILIDILKETTNKYLKGEAKQYLFKVRLVLGEDVFSDYDNN